MTGSFLLLLRLSGKVFRPEGALSSRAQKSFLLIFPLSVPFNEPVTWRVLESIAQTMQAQECIFCFIVSCQVFSFSSSFISFVSYQSVLVIFICISYIFCSRVIYVVSCISQFAGHIVQFLWVSSFGFLVTFVLEVSSFISLRRFSVLFTSDVVIYFMLICVFVILLFSVTVFNNVL